MKIKFIHIVALIVCSFLLVQHVAAQQGTTLYPVSRTDWNHAESNMLGSGRGYTYQKKCGYMDASGKMVIDYIYRYGSLFDNNGYAIVRDTIDHDKKEKGWQYIEPRDRHGNRCGIIDMQGKAVVPFVYSDLTYWPEQNWYVGFLTNKRFQDSIRIFCLDKNGEEAIYNGPYDRSMEIQKPINRIFMHQSQAGSALATTILDYTTGKEIVPLQQGNYYPIGQYVPVPANSKSECFMGIKQNEYGLYLQRSGPYAITTFDAQKVLYDSIINVMFVDGEAVVYHTDRKSVAVLDTLFKEIIPFSAGYTYIERLGGKAYFVIKEGQAAVIDCDQNVIIRFTTGAKVLSYNVSLFQIQDDSTHLFTIYDYDGNKVATNNTAMYVYNCGSDDYGMVIRFSDTAARLWKNKFIGKTYRCLSGFNTDGYCIFNNGTGSGLLNRHGDEILVTPYDEISFPINGILAASTTIPYFELEQHPCANGPMIRGNGIKQFLYLDLNGRRIDTALYDYVLPFNHGQAQVTKNCITYIIDQMGRSLTNEKQYSLLTNFANNNKVVQDADNRQALMDNSGTIISPWVDSFQLKSTRPDFQPIPMGRSNKKFRPIYSYGFKEGTTDYSFFQAGSFHTYPYVIALPDFQEGSIKFCQGGAYGLMDSLGHIIVPAIYQDIKSPVLGYRYVIKRDYQNTYWGLADHNGNIVIPVENYAIFTEPYRIFLIQKNKDGPYTTFACPPQAGKQY